MLAFVRRCLFRRFLLMALLLAVGLLLFLPANSEAHAILLESDPAKDAVLKVAPCGGCFALYHAAGPRHRDRYHQSGTRRQGPFQCAWRSEPGGTVANPYSDTLT
jgi:hypothetical protein